MQIDELPVGQSKKNFMLEEFPPDFDPQQQEKVDLPLKQRIKSKVWKVRLQAYDELANDEEMDSECVIQIIQDIHIQCQEKALQIASKYFEKQNQIECSYQKEIIKVLLEKVLTQPKLKQLGLQVSTQLYPNCKSAFSEIIIQYLIHKNPKVVQATIALLIELLQQFGLKKLDNLKPFFPVMSKLTEAQQSTVKADAIAFYREVTKWYGKNIEAFFGGLNEKFQLELKKIAETITEVQKALNQEEEAETNNQELYDLVDAVEVFSKYTETWCEKVFQLEKWQEKKEQLDNLQKSCSVPKIQPSPNIYSVVQLLKKLLNEQQMIISTQCIKIIGCMANGLRKNFNQYAKIIMLPVLTKLKDKKQNIVDETIFTIKKLFYSCSLDELFEELKALLEDKAPGPKINVFIIIEHYLDETPKDKLNKLLCIKQLVPICKKFTEDGNADVRTKSIMLMAKISAKLYNGALSIDLKGDKYTKYQNQVNIYMEGIIASSGKEVLQQQNQQQQQQLQQPQQQQQQLLQKQLIPNKENLQLQVTNTSNNSQKQSIQSKLNKSLSINQQNQNDVQQLQYSTTMTSLQVDAFLKQYKSIKNKDQSELGNILLQITQQSNYILSVTMEFIIDKMSEQKPLCYQLFDKIAQAYQPNHLTQLITTFKNASTQSQLLEVLNILLKYIPQSEKNIDQQLISEFLKTYQHQSNLKTRTLVQECQNALKLLFEVKKVQTEEKKMIPFPLNTFSDQHFERIKTQLKVPQIPQALYEKMFSYNIQQNQQAAAYIKAKITQPGEFSEIFFKWAYMISWMKENIPLQQEISQLFQILITQHTPTFLEQQIIFSYIKMLILIYLRAGVPKLAQRTLPLLMNLLSEFKKYYVQQPISIVFEDFDELSNQQANKVIQIMADNANDWNICNTLQQKQLIALLISYLWKEESVIIPKQTVQATSPQFQKSQIIQTSQNNEIPYKDQIQNCQRFNPLFVAEQSKTEQTNSEKKNIQPKSTPYNVQVNSQINSGNIQQPQNSMEIELDQNIKIFQQLYFKYKETNNFENPQLLADQIIVLLNNFMKEQSCDKLNQLLETLLYILSTGQFLKLISYDKFYIIFDTLIFKMVEESTKVGNKDGAQRNCYSLINQSLIKILNNQELPILYLGFLDCLIKVKETQKQTKQFYTLITKCLSKSVGQVKSQFQWQQLQAILEKINRYLLICEKQEPNQEFQESQDFLLKALKSTVIYLLHFNDGVKVCQYITQLTNEQSALRQWLLEFQENNVAKQKRSRDTHINQIIELLKIDFDKTVEQFVSIVRRQNIDWKPMVEFLSEQQIRFIELRLEQTNHMNLLEKKVGELEKMLNQ
ncbi:unnamed protein product (macronuclear) [Paramecium tetraurelia]|uniref:TOG domain-containing protein n=1 Tax=Paramecium tetraurelia TaxID=5888 RepID=A0CK07_PARTE|nr:uncharacterized protein GSPATT00000836001 [Paramecium tetraurelia]CAK71124.1 unnamed protein product [Paramecium tetraurelia]|eukprot:XP_001438521.1 hypothetical protein (macronuclear) [Paramecium tetraurelia strain d4-2]